MGSKRRPDRIAPPEALDRLSGGGCVVIEIKDSLSDEAKTGREGGNLRVASTGCRSMITLSTDLKHKRAPMALLATLLTLAVSFVGMTTAALAILRSKKLRKLGGARSAEEKLNRFGFCCALVSVGLLIGVIVLGHFFESI